MNKKQTEWGPEMALNMLGIGGPMAMTGAAGAAGGKLIQPQGIRAYHGSPHNFDKFDLSKIGTGEGAQAYGHGLYFAENPSVAQAYKDTLMPAARSRGTNYAEDAVKFYGGDKTKALLSLEDELIGASDNTRPLVESAIAYLKQDPKAVGRMYEVNINAKPEQFLDLDKPLVAQNERVMNDMLRQLPEVVKPHLHSGTTGSDLRAHLGGAVPKNAPVDAGVSNILREIGFPGTKYLDQGSRGAGDGTRNYVVFKPEIIDILKKYGVAGILGGQAAMGAGSPQPQSGI